MDTKKGTDENSFELKEQRKKATQKYRRLRTIISKAVETAKLCNIKLNVVTYDPKLHRLKERYTHDDIKIKDVVKLVMEDGASKHGGGLLACSKKKKTLSFSSLLAQEKGYIKTNCEGDSDQEDLEGPSRQDTANSKNLLE